MEIKVYSGCTPITAAVIAGGIGFVGLTAGITAFEGFMEHQGI